MHTLHFRFKKIYLVIDTSFTMVKFSAKDALKNDIIVKKNCTFLRLDTNDAMPRTGKQVITPMQCIYIVT